MRGKTHKAECVETPLTRRVEFILGRAERATRGRADPRVKPEGRLSPRTRGEVSEAASATCARAVDTYFKNSSV